MDSLKSKAEKLTALANGKLDQVKSEYDKTLAEIEKLNQQLQSKEMFVDRSENASFTVAIEARDRKQAVAQVMLRRIAEMEVERKEYTPMGFVQIGSTVCVEVVRINDNGNPNITNPMGSGDTPSEFVFKIVPEAFADARDGLTPVTGPFGRAALGHVAGDVVTAVAPMGNIQYLIKGVY